MVLADGIDTIIFIFLRYHYEEDVLDEESVATGKPDISGSLGHALRSPATEFICAHSERWRYRFQLGGGFVCVAEILNLPIAFPCS